MQKTVVTLILTASLACASAACADSPQPKKPETIAHRGFWKQEGSAQNSISSLQNSVRQGCFGTEFDIWVTTDGVPVLFHDRKTTKGLVLEDVTYAELMEQDGTLKNGEKIPTLREFLEAWNHAPVKLIFELKSHRDAERDAWAVARSLEVLRDYGVGTDEIEYIAFSRHVCKALIDQECGSPVSYLSGDLSPAEALGELGVQGIDYNQKALREHPEWIGEAHELGMIVNVWTVNEEADMRHFISEGVDYITTDRPDLLMEILAE